MAASEDDAAAALAELRKGGGKPLTLSDAEADFVLRRNQSALELLEWLAHRYRKEPQVSRRVAEQTARLKQTLPYLARRDR